MNHNTILKFYCAVVFWSSSKSHHSVRAKFENQKFAKFDEKQYECSFTNWFSIWLFQFSKIFKSNKFFDDTAFQSTIFFFCIDNFSSILMRDNWSFHKRSPFFISKKPRIKYSQYLPTKSNEYRFFFSFFKFFFFQLSFFSDMNSFDSSKFIDWIFWFLRLYVV